MNYETIKKNYEFRRLYAKGKSAVTPTLVVYRKGVITAEEYQQITGEVYN